MSKAPLASREQQIHQSNAEQGQRLGAMRLDEEHAQNRARPVPTEETDGPENRVDRDSEDGSAQQQSQQSGKKLKKDQSHEDDGGSPGVSPNSRDIDVVA